MKLERIGAPPGDFLTLDQVKAHLRVMHDDEDDLIRALADGALAHIDGPRGVLGRCIQPQEWLLSVEGGLSPAFFRLPIPGVGTVAATWLDQDGAAQVAGLERTDSGIWTDIRVTAPFRRPVRVVFSAATDADVWPAIRTALLLLVAHWYRNREAASEDRFEALPFAVRSLLSPLKARWVA